MALPTCPTLTGEDRFDVCGKFGEFDTLTVCSRGHFSADMLCREDYNALCDNDMTCGICTALDLPEDEAAILRLINGQPFYPGVQAARAEQAEIAAAKHARTEDLVGCPK